MTRKACVAFGPNYWLKIRDFSRLQAVVYTVKVAVPQNVQDRHVVTIHH